MIVYGYDRHFIDNNEIKILKAFAREKKLIIVSPGTYHSWCDINIACNCLQWIELFRHAELIVTDTFHGTIVSVISNKPMAVFIRSNINLNKLTDLIQRLNIADRQIKLFSLEELNRIFNEKMDYQKINEQIYRFRNDGLIYLKDALQKCQISR
jgi:hypothetical protein